MPDRILVVIPCYNCAAQIVRVIAQFDDVSIPGICEILVVDNRSTDGTPEAAAMALSRQNVPWKILQNEQNYNLGGSHKVAFAYALKNGHSHVIVLHGDDQAHIRDIIPTLERGAHRQVDALLGARFGPGAKLHGYSTFRTFGNLIFNLLVSLLCKQRIYDLGSGLNLFARKIFEEGDHSRAADDLTFNVFLLLTMSYRKRALKFFPIHWSESDQISNARLFKQSRKILGLLGAYFLRPENTVDRDRSTPDFRYTYKVWRSIEHSYDG